MRKTFLAICLVLAGLQQAAAQPAPPQGPCYTAKLSNSSGVLLRLTNGLRFQVFPGAGRTAVTTWLPLDKLQVCRGNGGSYKITNLSRPRPSAVMVLQQYN
jgi:hypothetical protein